jgi:hypothetical protein
MPKKISKSNTTPEMEQADREAAERLHAKRCMHFEVGTFIHRRYSRAEIIGRPGNGFMLVRWEDGTTEILRPMGISHERHNT